MLSSEFVIIENPLDENHEVSGVFLLNRNLYIYGKKDWIKFDLHGNKEEHYSSSLKTSDWCILCTN